MQQNRLIDAFDRINACVSDDARWSCAADLFQGCGSDWISVGTAARASQAALAVRTTTPGALMDDYVGTRLHLDDPWMRHCAASASIDRLDFDAAASSALVDRQSAIARLFRDHGVHAAILIPCYGGVRPGGLVLYARSAEASAHLAGPPGLQDARLVAAITAAHYRPDQDFSQSPQIYSFRNPLSAREREVLLLLSTGLQTSRIAERMGIASITVNKHLATLRRKLGARTREQALAIAIRDRLIAI